MVTRRNLHISKRIRQNFKEYQLNDCEVSNASIELMLYRVCEGYKIDFPFTN